MPLLRCSSSLIGRSSLQRHLLPFTSFSRWRFFLHFMCATLHHEHEFPRPCTWRFRDHAADLHQPWPFVGIDCRCASSWVLGGFDVFQSNGGDQSGLIYSTGPFVHHYVDLAELELWFRWAVYLCIGSKYIHCYLISAFLLRLFSMGLGLEARNLSMVSTAEEKQCWYYTFSKNVMNYPGFSPASRDIYNIGSQIPPSTLLSTFWGKKISRSVRRAPVSYVPSLKLLHHSYYDYVSCRSKSYTDYRVTDSQTFLQLSSRCFYIRTSHQFSPAFLRWISNSDVS